MLASDHDQHVKITRILISFVVLFQNILDTRRHVIFRGVYGKTTASLYYHLYLFQSSALFTPTYSHYN